MCFRVQFVIVKIPILLISQSWLLSYLVIPTDRYVVYKCEELTCSFSLIEQIKLVYWIGKKKKKKLASVNGMYFRTRRHKDENPFLIEHFEKVKYRYS